MKRNTKVGTWLPIFPGFYETRFDFDYERAFEDLQEFYKVKEKGSFDFYNFLEWDKYKEDVAKLCCEFIENNLSDFVTSVVFEEVRSPREYNFATDAINCTIVPKTTSIRKYIHANKYNFDKYLKDHYTSRDGFSSWYDNSYEDWKTNTNDFRDLDKKHELGAILQFIILNEYSDLDESENSVMADMYSYVNEHLHSSTEYLSQEFFDKYEKVEDSIKLNYTKPSILLAVLAELDEEITEMFDIEAIIAEITEKIENHTLKLTF